jgi:site-specific DNA-methyltransferase (adenine-specific)
VIETKKRKKMLKIKKSTAYLGDALQVLQHLPTHFFDVCIADPPYNMSKKKGLSWAFSKHVTMQEVWDQFTDEEYFSFTVRWLSEICRVVKPNGNILVFGTFHNIYSLGFILQKLNRKVLNSIIWMKPNAQPNITCRMLTESTEQIIWACNETSKKATNWTFNYQLAKTFNDGKQLRNFWSIPLTPRSERVAGHPTQKPLSLIERLVLVCSKPNDWILDPFAGVGTTGVAAIKHGRRAVMIEKANKFVLAQKLRVEKMGAGKEFLFETFKLPREGKKPQRTAKAEVNPPSGRASIDQVLL